MEGYFKNLLYHFFRRIVALSVGFNMKPLKKGFPVLRQKATEILAKNLTQILKEATIHYCLFDESHFSNICTLLVHF